MIPSTTIPPRTARMRLPSSILAVGVLFLALGALDVYQGAVPIVSSIGRSRIAGDDMLVLAIGVAAVVGGCQLLRARSWARWLLVAWMVLHVAISAGRPAAFGAHLAIFGGIAFLLFRSRATPHFRVRPATNAHPERPNDQS
jgi:hypothetical protein